MRAGFAEPKKGSRRMSCPICDNKPANCDCSTDAIRLHEENTEIAAERDRYKEALTSIWVTEPVGSPAYWKAKNALHDSSDRR